jgi:teichoic acid glycerol-phosphate primase
MQKTYHPVALNPNTYVHLTDHLAPLSVIMDMPLLLTDETHAKMAEKYYPGLKTLLLDWEEVTPQYLIENFDAFFQSDPWPRQDFYRNFKKLEEYHQKEVRNVFCPHGFSDKLFWFEKSVWEDITLIYGQNMLDMYKAMGIEQHLNVGVRTGNYRYQFYKKHQAFYDKIVEEEIWNKFEGVQPTILYAPTCYDLDKNTSFLDSDPILANVSDSYNLLVKTHPVLEETHSPALYKMIGKYEKKKNIVFVKDFPLVYPILARSDIYIGDMSSLGYDFLTFNRPMFFLNQYKRDSKTDRNAFLYRCGVEVMPEQYSDLYKILDKQLPSDQEHYGKIRNEIYQYTFGTEIPFAELKKNITQSFSSPKKWE